MPSHHPPSSSLVSLNDNLDDPELPRESPRDMRSSSSSSSTQSLQDFPNLSLSEDSWMYFPKMPRPVVMGTLDDVFLAVEETSGVLRAATERIIGGRYTATGVWILL